MITYWIVFISILISCIVIAVRIFFSSNRLINSDRSFQKNKNTMSKKDIKETLRELKLKLLSIQDASQNYGNMINKLESRIEALEGGKRLQQPKENPENVKNSEEIYLK